MMSELKTLQEDEEYSQLPDELQKIIDSDPNIPKDATSRKVIANMYYKGEFPLSSEVAKYNEEYELAAEIIFENSRKNGDHRRLLEMTGLKGTINFDKRAQYLGFILPVFLVVTGIYAMSKGWEALAYGIITVGVAPIVKSFFGRSRED